MFQRTSVLLALVLVLAGISVGAASADEIPALDLPPGIEAQAQPLLEEMELRMVSMGMTPEMMEQHMQHMQTMVDELPPGIFLNLLKLMPQLDMPDMMTLHNAMTQGNLMQQPPGQILKFVKSLSK